MPPKTCTGIQDTLTGLWLTGYSMPPFQAIFGSQQNALCLTPLQVSQILGLLNNSERYKEGAVLPDKGF